MDLGSWWVSALIHHPWLHHCIMIYGRWNHLQSSWPYNHASKSWHVYINFPQTHVREKLKEKDQKPMAENARGKKDNNSHDASSEAAFGTKATKRMLKLALKVKPANSYESVAEILIKFNEAVSLQGILSCWTQLKRSGQTDWFMIPNGVWKHYQNLEMSFQMFPTWMNLQKFPLGTKPCHDRLLQV